MSGQGTRIARRGLMLVLSSPSGAGKTTISRELLAQEPNIELSVSCTTRPKRPGEATGRDYHFVSLEDFDLMRNRREFLEFAKVFGHYYGTPRKPVEAALAQGRDILFDIDWQGTQQLAQTARSDLVSVFVLPPSAAELGRRLRRRASDPDDVVEARMAKAAEEISHWAEYDYIIVNDDVAKSVADVRAILNAERLRRTRQVSLTDLVKRLQSEL